MDVDTLSEMLSKRPLRLLQGAIAKDEMHICRIATHISSSLFTLLALEPGNSWPIIAGIFGTLSFLVHIIFSGMSSESSDILYSFQAVDGNILNEHR